MDGLLRIYAPSSEREITCILKKRVILIIVTLAPHYLKQLNAFIYPEVKLHSEALELIDDLPLITRQQVGYTRSLLLEQRINLLQMTPLF